MANDLWLYFLAVLAVILLPGMDMAYVLASSLSSGPRGAIASVLGIAGGGIIHVVVGATGIVTLMALFPQLFHIMLAIGTLYLVWIGVNIYRSADAPAPLEELPQHATGAIFRRAVLTCLLNPKAYAFTLAILPAFMRGEHDADPARTAARTIALCLITAATQIAVYGAVAALAVQSAQYLRERRKAITRTMGTLLIGAALLTATHAWSAPLPGKTLPTVSNVPRHANMTSTLLPPIHNANEKPGRSDFDFETGDWQVENRKLVNALEEGSAWETFASIVHMEKLPGGIGNFDTFVAPSWRPNWMGMAIRIFNGETGLWSIFLANSRNGGIVASGHLDVPVVGKFENGTGIFEGDDVINGVALRCRFTWSDTRTDHPKWQQDFSFDGGKTWKPNWFMTYTRLK